jgi:hypothetical protein
VRGGIRRQRSVFAQQGLNARAALFARKDFHDNKGMTLLILKKFPTRFQFGAQGGARAVEAAFNRSHW